MSVSIAPIRADQPSVPLEELTGVWSRALYVRGDGTTDDATTVTWVQGPRSYVDLRQPPRRPSMSGVGCLRDLTAPQLAWLAGQEGFAGNLRADATDAEWERYVDMQPASPPDVGRLAWRQELLVEEGVGDPYVEHWVQRSSGAAPSTGVPPMGVRLLDPATGAGGVLVRVGNTFGYARGRDIRIGRPPSTAARVAAASTLTDAQDLLDCELAIGRVDGDAWIIEHSSLPFREGCSLELTLDGPTCTASDATPEGVPRARRWRVVATD